MSEWISYLFWKATNRLHFWIFSLLGYEIIREGQWGKLPKIGQICWVRMLFFGKREHVFKERSRELWLDEWNFRYYFESIDGSFVNLTDSCMIKKRDIIAWDFRDDNPKNKMPELPK